MKVYIVIKSARFHDGDTKNLKVFLDEAKALAYADTQEDEFYYIFIEEQEVEDAI